ncbi:hypothetical protein BHE74_00031054 [Ensete ventricosum]|nr:hypothetical protein BHE74_00031054 [Ensete ventricosum]RZR99098.1 hypothetical protein BHM03_00028607 [Ensete ventricosum]
MFGGGVRSHAPRRSWKILEMLTDHRREAGEKHTPGSCVVIVQPPFPSSSAIIPVAPLHWGHTSANCSPALAVVSPPSVPITTFGPPAYIKWCKNESDGGDDMADDRSPRHRPQLIGKKPLCPAWKRSLKEVHGGELQRP